MEHGAGSMEHGAGSMEQGAGSVGQRVGFRVLSYEYGDFISVNFYRGCLQQVNPIPHVRD